MTEFIDDHRDVDGIKPIRRVLPITPSACHAHVARRSDPSKASARARHDAALRGTICRAFDENFRLYGVSKIWWHLKRGGESIARCTVARLLKDMACGA